MGKNTFSKVKIFSGILIFAVFLALLERTALLDFVKAPVSYITSPIQLSLYRSYQSASNLVAAFADVSGLRTDNAALEIENAILKAQISKLERVEKENQALREQIGEPSLGMKQIASATVIGFGTAGVHSSFLIEAGNASHVKSGDLVVLKNIYLGKVIEVSARTSRVQLIVDPATRINALTGSNAEGILVGQYGTQASLTSVTQDESLKVGDLVLSSGGESLPKGLVLGKISKVQKVSRELFQGATVELLLDLRKLETVFVYRYE